MPTSHPYFFIKATTKRLTSIFTSNLLLLIIEIKILITILWNLLRSIRLWLTPFIQEKSENIFTPFQSQTLQRWHFQNIFKCKFFNFKLRRSRLINACWKNQKFINSFAIWVYLNFPLTYYICSQFLH